jgi:hypothetical protein
MSEKQGVIANAAFASILKRLLCMGKDFRIVSLPFENM